jgi:hypothetical protein
MLIYQGRAEPRMSIQVVQIQYRLCKTLPCAGSEAPAEIRAHDGSAELQEGFRIKHKNDPTDKNPFSNFEIRFVYRLI